MSYYPLLAAPGCEGWATLCNFAPNSWEVRDRTAKLVNVTWSDGENWQSRNLGILPHNAIRSVMRAELEALVPADVLPLLSLTRTPLPAESSGLPKLDGPKTVVPAWRSTLGLRSSQASTSYQGEVDPFPPQGTLLTFGPFMQFATGVENYLILLNLENSPVSRTVEVEIYNSAQTSLKARFEARNNAANVIALDSLGLAPSDLPLVICRKMAAIPLYFSKTADGSHLSLEHTHPPASYVIHGKRFEVQKMLKNLWFSKAAP
jgi:hypothetical protein